MTLKEHQLYEPPPVPNRRAFATRQFAAEVKEAKLDDHYHWEPERILAEAREQCADKKNASGRAVANGRIGEKRMQALLMADWQPEYSEEDAQGDDDDDDDNDDGASPSHADTAMQQRPPTRSGPQAKPLATPRQAPHPQGSSGKPRRFSAFAPLAAMSDFLSGVLARQRVAAMDDEPEADDPDLTPTLAPAPGPASGLSRRSSSTNTDSNPSYSNFMARGLQQGNQQRSGERAPARSHADLKSISNRSKSTSSILLPPLELGQALGGNYPSDQVLLTLGSTSHAQGRAVPSDSEAYFEQDGLALDHCPSGSGQLSEPLAVLGLGTDLPLPHSSGQGDAQAQLQPHSLSNPLVSLSFDKVRTGLRRYSALVPSLSTQAELAALALQHKSAENAAHRSRRSSVTNVDPRGAAAFPAAGAGAAGAGAGAGALALPAGAAPPAGQGSDSRRLSLDAYKGRVRRRSMLTTSYFDEPQLPGTPSPGDSGSQALSPGADTHNPVGPAPEGRARHPSGSHVGTAAEDLFAPASGAAGAAGGGWEARPMALRGMGSVLSTSQLALAGAAPGRPMQLALLSHASRSGASAPMPLQMPGVQRE